MVEAVLPTAIWYPGAQRVLPIRCVVIHDPTRKSKTLGLLSRDVAIVPVWLINWFMVRYKVHEGEAGVTRETEHNLFRPGSARLVA